jgi:hypothetical protein
MAVLRWLDRFGVVGATSMPRAPHGYDFASNVLHVDEDGICPRCLCWIGPEDIVRRTAYGPAQHEYCPVVAAALVDR